MTLTPTWTRSRHFEVSGSRELNLGVNLRLRYTIREGAAFWVVYNEGIHTDRDGVPANIPTRPFSAARSVQVKWSHTLAL